MNPMVSMAPIPEHMRLHLQDLFRGIWCCRKVSLGCNAVFFHDLMPGVPVVFRNFCQVGPIIEPRVGALVKIGSQEIVLDLGVKASK